MKRAAAALALATSACLLLAGCPISAFEVGDAFARSAADSSRTMPGASASAAQDTVELGPSQSGSELSTASRAVPDESTLVSGPCDCFVPPEADVWAAEVLRLVNLERQQESLPPLAGEPTLAAQAEQYACELICDDFFAHVNPVTGSTLTDRSAEFEYAYWAIGENLAAGQPTPEAAVTAWMNSPDHRANVLHPAFTEIGVAVRVGGDYGIYWVQEFGRPRGEGPYVPEDAEGGE